MAAEWDGTNTKLKDYIKFYDDLVPYQFCNDIIEAFSADGGEEIDREQRPSFTQLNITEKWRKKDKRWIYIQDKLTDVFNDVVDLYMKDLDCAQDFPAQFAFEEFRVKSYRNNDYDQFANHVDVQDYNSARRFLVLFLYCNTVTSGGETNFPNLNHWVQPHAGRILAFPATWQYRHAGLIPLSSNKIIVGSYLHYL